MAAMSTIPDPVGFEQAIALSKPLVSGIASGELSEPAIEEAVSRLVSTENGARGFFVTYLTEPGPAADTPSAGVLQGLRSAPARVAELMLKNLVMSTAMAVRHRRNGDETRAAGSVRVRARSARLIAALRSAEIRQRGEQLMETLTTGQGEYQAFLDRWGYDADQRRAMREALREVLEEARPELPRAAPSA